jgi:hypothetical protein
MLMALQALHMTCCYAAVIAVLLQQDWTVSTCTILQDLAPSHHALFPLFCRCCVSCRSRHAWCCVWGSWAGPCPACVAGGSLSGCRQQATALSYSSVLAWTLKQQPVLISSSLQDTQNHRQHMLNPACMVVQHTTLSCRRGAVIASLPITYRQQQHAVQTQVQVK